MCSPNCPMYRSQTCMCVFAIGMWVGCYCPDNCWQQGVIRTTRKLSATQLGFCPKWTSENSWLVHAVLCQQSNVIRRPKWPVHRGSKQEAELNYHKPNIRSVQSQKLMEHNTVISGNVRDRETGRCKMSACQKGDSRQDCTSNQDYHRHSGISGGIQSWGMSGIRCSDYPMYRNQTCKCVFAIGESMSTQRYYWCCIFQLPFPEALGAVSST
jgi:hypothetical protein